MAATTLSGMISNIVQEVITPKIDLMMLRVSPFFRHVFRDSRGVENDPRIGRDWKVLRTFTLGLAGASEFASMAGSATADPGSAVGYQAYSQVEVWPGLPEATAPAYVQRTITLKKLKVTMYVPVTIMRAARLGASIGDQVERTIDATAMRVAYDKANAFLSSTPGTNRVGTLATFLSDGTDISSSGVAVDLGISGEATASIRKFTSGMRVDLYKKSAPSVRVNSEPVFVDVCNPFTKADGSTAVTSGGGSIKLFTLGTSTVTMDATDYDITLRNCGREAGGNTTNMPTALEEVIVSDASIADWGISTADYPMLGSLVRDLGSAVLTEGQLLKHVAHYFHARGAVNMFDSLWSTAGVWAGYFNNLDSSFQIERNGTLLKVKGGAAEEVTFSLYGQNFACKADPMLPSGTIWGLKLGDQNWSMVTPPRVPRTSKSPVFDPGIEFLAPIMSGTGSIFQGYKKVGGADAGATTDFMEAPAEHPYECMPEVVPGMKLTGATEFYG